MIIRGCISRDVHVSGENKLEVKLFYVCTVQSVKHDLYVSEESLNAYYYSDSYIGKCTQNMVHMVQV